MEEQSVKRFTDVLPIVPLLAPESSISGKMKRGPGKETEGEPAQKRAVTYKTFKKWRTELDREYQTVSWLNCDSLRRRERSCEATEVLRLQQVLRRASGADAISVNDGSSVPIQFTRATSKTMLSWTSTRTQ